MKASAEEAVELSLLRNGAHSTERFSLAKGERIYAGCT